MSIMAASQPQAQELLLSDAYALVRDGDFEAVEHAFNRHQDAYNRELISAGNYVIPYDVFLTTDPRVVALTDAWLEAKPDSPQALVAKATFLSHVALIIRGTDILWDTPANSVMRMHQLYDRALPLFQRALDLEPRHLFAARTLGNFARYAGDREGRELADGIDRSLSGPRYSFYRDLHWLQPGWGGSESDMREACDEGAAALPSVTAGECHAVVTLELGTAPPKDLLDAARALEAID
ncbi:MAG: DUF4034 domain-containing protein, partial [Xanthomonadales bacterium]|nr:DUF4034 domain-containing protein [Xanthomonadales bacterium]